MRRLFLLAVLAGTVAACSTTKADKPPICDGKHRRPANLYGSVIVPQGGPEALATPPPAPAAPAADPQVKPQAHSAFPAVSGSCA